MSRNSLYMTAADAVLLTHVLFVVFVVLGMVYTLFGLLVAATWFLPAFRPARAGAGNKRAL